MSDHGRHFSSYEGHKERRTGKISWGFFKDAQGFGRLHALARAPASPAPGLHHHGPRYFFFLISVQCVALRNMDLLIKTGWSVMFPVFC